MNLAKEHPKSYDTLIVWSNSHFRNKTFKEIPRCLVFGVFKELNNAECSERIPKIIELEDKICASSDMMSDKLNQRTRTQFDEDFGVKFLLFS